MAWIQMHLFAQTLAEWTTINVLVPDGERKSLLPLLWLLPPLGMDHTAWLRMGALPSLAEEHGLVIALPDMRLSFGVDMVHGERYHTLLTEELPFRMAEYCCIDIKKQFIFGAEEGGYAALYAQMKRPELYTAAGAVDAVNGMDIMSVCADRALGRRAFGVEVSQQVLNPQYDLGRPMHGQVSVYMTQSTVYGKQINALAKAVTGIEAQHVMGKKWEGWRMALQGFLGQIDASSIS